MLSHSPVCAAGTAKVILDIGVETTVKINRPALLGERVHLSVQSYDLAAGTYQLAEAAMAQPVARPLPLELASTDVPISPLVHATQAL